MPETANFATSAATARSHIDTSWQPAAVAMPCTRAITGCGRRVMASISSPHCRNSACMKPLSWLARISLRSWPAQKALPAPAMTTTRTASLAAMSSSSRLIAVNMSFDSELNWAGAVEGQRGQAVGAVGAQDDGFFEDHCGSPCAN